MKNKKNIGLAFLVVLGVLVFGNVQAQEMTGQGNDSGVSCFDYYKFQSVQVSVGADKDDYSPGDAVSFKGELVNENNYPVVDGNVFVRIGEYNENYTSEGHFTIDEFMAKENVSLDSNESQPIEFEWMVPQNISKGKYRVDYFFSVGKKFNLGGLPFSNEVVIGSTEFNVNSDQTAYISFDKSATKVNGEEYTHIGNWPRIEPGQKAEISQKLTNTFSEDKSVGVTYDLYFWDALDEKDKISSKKETITVPAKSSKALSYTIDSMDDSVYFLKMTAVASDGQKSIVNIRLVSEQFHPRLNFPSPTQFPLKKGQADTLFTCYHNSSSVVQNGTVEVRLLDKNSKEIARASYSGDIPGDMSVVKKDFTPEKDYDWVRLAATVKDQNGQVVDQYQTVYDCQKINPSKCLTQKVTAPQIKKDATKKSAGAVVILLLIIILSVLGVLIYKKKMKSSSLGVFLVLFASAAFLLMFASGAEAYNQKSVTSAISYDIKRIAIGGMAEGDASITHRVGMVSGGYANEVGDAINFDYQPDKPFFVLVGGPWGTPYGAWCSNSNDVCGGDFMYYNWRGYDDGTSFTMKLAYNTVTAVKPTLNISSSNTSVVNCSGLNCTAIGPGEATLTANIPDTEGSSWVTSSTFGQREVWIPFARTITPDFCESINPMDIHPYSCDNYYSNLLATSYLDRHISFPAKTVSWDVTVTAPGESVTIELEDTSGTPIPYTGIVSFKKDNVATYHAAFSGSSVGAWSGNLLDAGSANLSIVDTSIPSFPEKTYSASASTTTCNITDGGSCQMFLKYAACNPNWQKSCIEDTSFEPGVCDSSNCGQEITTSQEICTWTKINSGCPSSTPSAPCNLVCPQVKEVCKCGGTNWTETNP